MRVALYTDAVELGGAELSLRNLAAHLDQGLEVSVLGVEPGIVRRIAAGRPDASTHVVQGQTRGLDMRALRDHIRAIRALRPDVLHCNLSSPWSCQYAVAAAAASPATRVVAVYHLCVPPANELQRRLKRLTSPRISAHVAVGRRTAREVEALVPLRRGSVRAIHNGVPVGPIVDRSNRSPAHSIGVVGRVERQKGLDLLLEALALLPGVELRIVGDGADRDELQRLAARLDVADRVVWRGWVDDPRAELLLMDVFVQPSRFEGFPLAVLEAMLAELPVVAADVGSVSEAVLDGETGRLVAAGDAKALAEAIGELLADGGKREAVGRRARARVLEHFTADAMAAEYESLYREIVP